MPTRYIKESACTSPNLSRLSHGAERCLWRLVTKADDYGRFDAAPLVVLGACFPTVPGVTLADVEGWLAEMVREKAIHLYRAGGRRLGYFTKWEKHQGVPRARLSKYPEPPANANTHRPHSLPRESDVENLIFEQLGTANHLFGKPILSLSRQERIGNSYIDLVARTNGNPFAIEIKRGRLTPKSLVQITNYLRLVGSEGIGILVGAGLSSNFPMKDCASRRVAVIVYDSRLRGNLVSPLPGVVDSCPFLLPHVKSQLDNVKYGHPRICSSYSESKSSSSSGVRGPQKVGHILAQNATKIIPPQT